MRETGMYVFVSMCTYMCVCVCRFLYLRCFFFLCVLSIRRTYARTHVCGGIPVVMPNYPKSCNESKKRKNKKSRRE
jgi:hypothetical protein